MAKTIEMKDFAMVSTSVLPTRVSETIIAAAIEQLQEAGVMRPFCYVDTSPSEGDATYIYNTFDDLTDAYDRKEGADFKYDSAGATQSSADMIEIAKGFKITWEADHLKKLAIRAAQVKACVQKVQRREDTKIVSVLSGATSSVTAAGTLDGASADPIKDIAQAKRKIRDLGYSANTLFIENANLEELCSIIGANDWYKITESMISKGALPTFMGLKIRELSSDHLTHGTAYVAHCSGGTDSAIWIGEAHGIRTHIFDDDDAHCTKVQVYERICPVLVRPDAVAKITGW